MHSDRLAEIARSEPVLAVSGRSGAGKTTLLEAVLPTLRSRGLRVGVFKHDVHGITLDPSGKDSARLFEAGADVVLGGPGESLGRSHGRSWRGLAAEIDRLLADNDLVLVEGRASTPLPKVWLASPDDPEPPAEVEHVADVLPRGEGRPERFLDLLDRWLPERWRQRPVLGGILVGGRSRRMIGVPKQLLRRAGTTLVEGVWSVLGSRVERVVLLGDGPAPSVLAKAPRLADAGDVRGPMAGILAALRWAPRATWVIASCDLPMVEGEALDWLLGQRSPGCWAVFPCPRGECMEPLLAVYEPQSRALLEAAAANGEFAPRCVSADPSVICPQPPSALASAWVNVNSPGDLKALDGGKGVGPEGVAGARGGRGDMEGLRRTVRAHLDHQEGLLPPAAAMSSLWAHSLRVARLARRLAGDTDGADPEDAFLAGLLHDAGKFVGGSYHAGDEPEEMWSAAWAQEVLPAFGFAEEKVDLVAAGIRGVYRDEDEPDLLAALVQDADNLDKLGPHGVAGFFVKAGLRGRGLDRDMLARIGVELTYARYAAGAMLTLAGRDLAGPWGRRSEELLLELLESVRDGGLLGWEMETLVHADVEIVAVRPDRCECSGEISCSLHGEESVTCTMLRLEQVCDRCGDRRNVRFCCPRIGHGDPD